MAIVLDDIDEIVDEVKKFWARIAKFHLYIIQCHTNMRISVSCAGSTNVSKI